MSYSQSFPSAFDTVTPTNQVLKNLDNETKKIYQIVNEVLASDGHAHTGNGSDGAKINASGMINTPSGNIVATTVQGAINELDAEKVSKGELFINVKDHGVVSDWNGTTGTDNTIAINNAVSLGCNLLFPEGRYSFNGSLNFAKQGMRIVGIGNVELHHTGTGKAVTLDAGTSSNMYDMYIENLLISGNSNTTDGFYTRGCHHIKTKGIRVKDVTTAYRSEFCVEATHDNFTCSSNYGAFSKVPMTGIALDKRNTGEYCVGVNFRNAIIEGVSGYGVQLINANNCNFKGGTSEANGYGINIEERCERNNFESFWLEVNAVRDLTVYGNQNTFKNCYIGSNACSGNNVEVAGGYLNSFRGGYVRVVNLQNSSSYTIFDGVKFSDNADLGINGPGTRMVSSCLKIDVNNLVTGIYSDAPLMDTGTFLPTIAGNITAGVNTYTTQLGKYYKFGNIVFFEIDVNINIKDANMNGAVYIDGFPFYSANQTDLAIASHNNITMDSGRTQLGCVISAGDRTLVLNESGSNATSYTIASSYIVNGSRIRLSGMCFI